jgi:MFS family permease
LFFSGAIVGSVLTKFLGNPKYSATFVMMDILALMSVFTSFVPNMWCLFATRFLQGGLAGVNFILSAGYMRELSPKSLLADFSTLSTACLIGGFILGTSIFLPYAFHVEFSNYWTLCVGFGSIFPAVRLILVISKNQETPAYWLKENKQGAARDVFNAIYPIKNLGLAELTLEEHQEAIEWLIRREEKLLRDAMPSTKPNLPQKSCKGYNSALIGVYVWFFNQFTGLQGINSYSSAVFRTFTTDETATLITIS